MLVIHLLMSGAQAAPEYPVPAAARPVTLPQSSVRIDADTLVGLQSGSQAAADLSAGFGVGVTDELEIGAEVLPIDLSPAVTYGSPSLYASYGADLSDAVQLAPGARVFIPISEGSLAMLDAEAELQVQSDRDLQLSVTPTAHVSFEQGGAEPAFAAPVELLVQPHRRVFLTLDSGVSTDPLDVRWRAPRPSVVDDALVVPFGGGIGTTLGRPGGAVSDLALGAYWPRLAQFAQVASTHTEDFAVMATFQSVIPTDRPQVRGKRTAGRY